MKPLVAAELLRLRTVRGPRWVALGGLVLVAFVAVSNLRSDAHLGPHALADAMRALTVTGVLLPGVFAASTVGAAFQRGELATTYLTHPRRAGPATAQALVFAGVGLVFAGLAAGIVVTVGAATASGGGLPTGDAAQVVAGGAVGGAVMSAAGVGLAAATRHATIAGGALVGVEIVESLLRAGGAGAYGPFGLVDSMMGSPEGAPAPAALALLIVYLAAFALAVRAWALPRDLT